MFENIKGNTVEISGTRFFFSKMRAMQAFPVVEKIRFGLGKLDALDSLKAMDFSTDDVTVEDFVVFAKVILGIEPKLVEEIRVTLFQHVHYQNKSTSKQVLAGSEDQAFQDCGIDAIYEVLIRSLVVNFYDFFVDIGSRFR